jgi:signal transduction histidine kinase
MALESLSPDDGNRPLLDQVQGAADRAATITQQLLAFSRKQVLTAAEFDVNDVVRRVVEMLTRLIGEDIALDIRLDPNPALVKADQNQVEAALLNLALNARDAMPDGGTLTISTTFVAAAPGRAERSTRNAASGSYAELVIRDTGAGIDPAVLPHVFEPFYSTKARDKGMGLKLATVYGIVTQSGGSVSVSSRPGQGSSFFIRLPGVA